MSQQDKISTEAQEIWIKYEPYIRRLCNFKLSSCPERAEDCVQDVFLALLAAMKKGYVIRERKAWLTAVAWNKIRDVYDEINREQEKTVPLSGELADVLADERDAADRISDNRIEDAQKKFLLSLNSTERELYRLRFEEERSIKDISAALGISEGNVKIRIFRLKQKAKAFSENYSFL